MNPLYILAVLFSMLTGGIITTALQGEAGENTLVDTILVTEDSGLDGRVTDVYNAVQNMRNGDVSSVKVEEFILEEKHFAKDRAVSDNTGQEKRYIEFLEAAEDVVTAYKYQSDDLHEKIQIMTDLKNELI